MNEFLAFFVIVSVFAFNVFCMNPSNLGLEFPDAPENVELDECFVVHEIREITCSNLYDYNHICPQKLPQSDNEGQPRKDERVWYFIGTRKDSDATDLPKFHYVSFKQYFLQLIFLKEKMLEIRLRFTLREIYIEFQSLQQSQAFYGMIYSDVHMSQAAENKIGVLHEMTKQENRKMGNNVAALYESIDDTLYLTFKNEQGEPLLIFSQKEARIERIKVSQNDKLQLMLQIHATHYILTFSSNAEARQFSSALLQHNVKVLFKHKVFPKIRERFESNDITIDPQDV